MATIMKKIESERVVEPFSGVSSSHGIDILYSQSESYSLKIKAKAKLIEHIETTVENGILRITWKNERVGFLKSKIMQQSAVSVYLSAPMLNSIELSTGTDLRAETIQNNGELIIHLANGSGLEANHVKADNIALHTKQASGIKIRAVKASTISIESEAHSDVDLSGIEAEKIFISASGFSDTTLSGIAKTIAISTRGSSDTDIKELKYGEININNSKGSSIYK